MFLKWQLTTTFRYNALQWCNTSKALKVSSRLDIPMQLKYTVNVNM